MFTCDWLVGKLSLERDLTNCLDPLSTDLLFSTISVLIKTLDIYVELKIIQKKGKTELINLNIINKINLN